MNEMSHAERVLALVVAVATLGAIHSIVAWPETAEGGSLARAIELEARAIAAEQTTVTFVAPGSDEP